MLIKAAKFREYKILADFVVALSSYQKKFRET